MQAAQGGRPGADAVHPCAEPCPAVDKPDKDEGPEGPVEYIAYLHEHFARILKPHGDLLRKETAPITDSPTAQSDSDGDGYGDDWMEAFEAHAAAIRGRANDSDQDRLVNLQEYRWLTIPIGPLLTPSDVPGAPPVVSYPTAKDYDSDGWRDGPEVAYWNDPGNDDSLNGDAWAAARLAPVDPDWRRNDDNDSLTTTHDSDSDNDGLPDGYEYLVTGTYPERPDSDCALIAVRCDGPGATVHDTREGSPGTGDGLNDSEEDAYWRALLGDQGSRHDCDGDLIPNILDPDADNDGLNDSTEVRPAAGVPPSNPCKDDGDEDGLKDGDERLHGTDPRNPDTDGDGMPDGWEVSYQLNPLIPFDASLDPDLDTLANLEEHGLKTHPRNNDTDRDALADNAEAHTHRTDPTRWDTDGDLMPDGWELGYGLDPLDAADAHADPDADAARDGPDGPPRYVHTNEKEYRYLRPSTWNESEQGAWIGGTSPVAPDSDGDGRFDGTEIAEGDNPRLNTPSPDADPDQDGLTNDQEIRIGTYPGTADTDGDGLCDGGRGRGCAFPGGTASGAPGERLDYRSNPNAPDTDGDGLDDGTEAARFDAGASGTMPDTDGDGRGAIRDEDSDDDGLLDGAEHLHGTDPTIEDSDADGLTDYEELRLYRFEDVAPEPLDEDSDDDGLLDGDELERLHTHPNLPDTDWDGLRDPEEVARATDPNAHDTDGDRMPDGWEVLHGLDPLRHDADDDLDRDGILIGLTNYQEYRLGTLPEAFDTDGDLLNDYWEILFGLDPLAPEDEPDADEDGLVNIGEYLLGTKPSRADTDADGLPDGWEAGNLLAAPSLNPNLARTNPTATDTDGDGLDDGDELKSWKQYGTSAWNTDFDADGGPIENLNHNLRDADSDNDGLDDGQELLILGTHPGNRDTDGDLASDFDEIMTYGTNPHDPASRPEPGAVGTVERDSDGDKLSDYAETTRYGTDPGRADSDSDAINDGDERIGWNNDWLLNHDGDPLENNLLDPDSDNDGLSDGLEFASAGLNRQQFYVTSPRLADTDADGLLDSEEDTNGMYAGAAASGQQANDAPAPVELPRPTATLPQASERDGARQPYVVGAFGIHLYPRDVAGAGADPTMASTSASGSTNPQAGRASGNGPHPDRKDTDRDGLTDGTETRQYDTAWDNPDTDGDGLTDGEESDQGTNPNLADHDHDGLPDGKEARRAGQGRWTPYLPNPLDGDSDDDGILDGTEANSPLKGTEGIRLSAIDPDSDDDGLSDGLESGLRQPESAPNSGGQNLYTNLFASLACGQIPTPRPAFQPYEGVGTVTSPVERDSDSDGIIDGLEDVNFNGKFGRQDQDTLSNGKRELSPLDADFDHDRLSDGLELKRLPKTYCQAFAQGKEEPKYDETIQDATNPWLHDTDDDRVIDGLDLNPKGRSLVSMILKTYHQSGAIDMNSGPELVLTVELTTLAGRITVRAETKPDFPGGSLVGWLVGAYGSNDPVSGFGDFVEDSAMVTFDLNDDVTRYSADLGMLEKVDLMIKAEDRDEYDTDLDVADISGVPTPPVGHEGKVYYASDSLDTGQRDRDSLKLTQGSSIPLTADGTSDTGGDWHRLQDDGRLTADFIGGLDIYFVNQAIAAYRVGPSGVLGPAGTPLGS